MARYPGLSRASPGKCEDDPDIEYIWDFIAYFDYRDSMDHKTVFCPTLNPGELFFYKQPLPPVGGSLVGSIMTYLKIFLPVCILKTCLYHQIQEHRTSAQLSSSQVILDASGI